MFAKPGVQAVNDGRTFFSISISEVHKLKRTYTYQEYGRKASKLN
jgi:hypothetical protein